jgi:DNA topoisomerase IA
MTEDMLKGTSSIEATPLGISLVNTLEKYSPIIIDEKLTKDLQDETDAIVEAKSGFKEKEEHILDEAKETIIKISKDLKEPR